jgi:hypothetical protein
MIHSKFIVTSYHGQTGYRQNTTVLLSTTQQEGGEVMVLNESVRSTGRDLEAVRKKTVLD